MKPNYNRNPWSIQTTNPNWEYRVEKIDELLQELHDKQAEMIEAAVERVGLKDAREHLSRIFGKEIN